MSSALSSEGIETPLLSACRLPITPTAHRANGSRCAHGTRPPYANHVCTEAAPPTVPDAGRTPPPSSATETRPMRTSINTAIETESYARAHPEPGSAAGLEREVNGRL